MRFLLILGLIMFMGWGRTNTVYAAEKIDLSFSLYLQINGEFEHSEDGTMPEFSSLPLERELNVRDLHPGYILKDILMYFLTNKLGVKNIEDLKAQLITIFPESGVMITHIESVPSSTDVSPSLTHFKSALSIRSISPIPFEEDYSNSTTPEAGIPPVLPKQKEEFTRWNSLLTLKGDELIEVINGKLLKVSFQSITDSVGTIPFINDDD